MPGRRAHLLRLRRTLAVATAFLVPALACPGLAVALAPGDLDPGFGAGGSVTSSLGGTAPELFAVALQPDGKIVIAGGNRDSNGKSEALIARLNSDGTFDPSFGTGGVVAVQLGEGTTKQSIFDALALQPDGKILTGGFATDASGDAVFLAARLNGNGSFDPSFGTGGKVITSQYDAGATPVSDLNALALLPDGRILAAGDATDSGGHTAFLVVRLNSDGTPDASYGTGGKLVTQLGAGTNPSSSVLALTLQPDGKAIAGGYATDSNSRSEFLVVRLNTGGSPDATFGGGKVLSQLGLGGSPSSLVDALALQPDGRILAGGRATDSTGDTAFLVARLGSDGTPDPSFGAAGEQLTQVAPSGPFAPDSEVRGLALQPNAKILAAGRANGFLAARLNTNGSFDASFGAGGLVLNQLGQVRAVALQPDGKLVAAGDGTDSGGNSFLLVARLIADLPPAPSFSASPNPAAPGQPVAFNGGGSTDDGTITSYAWSFGDGASASGPAASHVYRRPGTYPASLTVRDDYGLSGTLTVSIKVNASAALSALSLRPRSFRAAPRGGSIARRTGTRVRYRDSVAATTTFTVLKRARGVRHGRRCTKPRRGGRGKPCVRYVAVGSFRHRDRAGANSFHFTGRVRRHKLAPGGYRLRAVPRLRGRAGRGATSGFRILP